ncbi:Ornithine decarboxylase [Danaus plexippus plexippus]|uniref:ornithine decarboxylase n=1 Tax=Danaus plexippus plexippus TaxID=278856 RepID=A0A212EPT9_DANPL|nr:ornithine decarboxylase 2-like [Danaus plexippus plexippus]OWR43515.1 Ornithine decarboxylase [Danaus plexippus plexippus]
MVIEKRVSKALVLENNTAEDVSRAMIEGGLQKDPFYIFDMDKAYQRVQYFKNMMPRIKIFYAVKSNDSDFMLKLAASLGLGFDCASPGEIHKVLKLKVSPLSIVFAMPTKSPEWMLYARQCGIKHTTFDNLCELNKIKQFWPDAKLLLRIRVHSDSVYDLGKKFGCDFETEAIDLLEEAAALNITVVGVAFHVGSGCSSPDSYVLGLQQVKQLFEHEDKAGRKMKIVDIGGGFLSDKTDRIDKVSKLVNNAIEELFPDPEVQVIAEPGRYLCDNSFTLYCNINTVRPVQVGDSSINMLYLNDGVFGCLRYNEPWHTVKRFRVHSEGEQLKPTVLWGPTCHPIDRVLDNLVIMLPACTIYDWLVFPSRGAYSMTMASRFSTLPEPHIRNVISQELFNILKDSKVLGLDDFLEQNIATPLPPTLPSIIVHSKILQTNYTLAV